MTTQQAAPAPARLASPKAPQDPRGAGSPVQTTPSTSRRTLFNVPFHSAMSDADIARLRAELGMETHFHPKHPAVVPPLGFVRLDFYSGLYLVRADGDGDWALECRTWGQPAPGIVHEWHLHAAYAARLLDSSVPIPPRAERSGLPNDSSPASGGRQT